MREALGDDRLEMAELVILGAREKLAGACGATRTGVLHYDRDYELIAERTDLGFDSVWLAARGSL